MQCKWGLRAAYYAQELLSTFDTSLGEVALIPTTGGVFTIDITVTSQADEIQEVVGRRLWDRASDGGFPGIRMIWALHIPFLIVEEVKHLKQMVRDVIDPTRGLGHNDRKASKPQVHVPTAKLGDDIPTRHIDQPLESESSDSHTAHGNISEAANACVVNKAAKSSCETCNEPDN